MKRLFGVLYFVRCFIYIFTDSSEIVMTETLQPLIIRGYQLTTKFMDIMACNLLSLQDVHSFK